MAVDYDTARKRMVAEQLVPRGIKDPRVLAAMRKVPRHFFMDPDMRSVAYSDRPLPIGEEQTISQPYIVALMTEALQLQGSEKVLEIGAGSGYQAAILAELARRVYTVERIPDLLERARSILEELGYGNVSFKLGDGTLGWEEFQPYDAIIVTAGAPRIPEPLYRQLADRGRMLIPVGNRYGQEMLKIVKEGDQMVKERLGGCRFVALRGEEGWREAD